MIYRFDKDRITPVRVRGGEKLYNIASMLRINYPILKKINMHLKKDFVPPNSNVMVNIPTSRLQMFHALYNRPRGQRVSSRF